MIGRAGYDLLRLAGRSGWFLLTRFWPVLLFWVAWHYSYVWWQDFLLTFPDNQPGGYATEGNAWALWAWPAAALLGPCAVMAVGIIVHRVGLGSRTMALVAVLGMAACAILTGWPEYQRLWPYVGRPGFSPAAILNGFDLSRAIAIIVGLVVAFVGFCIATRAQPIGSRSYPSLRRGTSDNFGHADWLAMDRARKRFPGPDPAYGGLVVGEAYRVDQDRAAQRGPFNPRDRSSWGQGGKAPLLIDPCHEGATHALVFAGSNGFKTTSAAIPTLLTWTGAAVVLDPSREIGPMLHAYRAERLGHRVVTLDPANAASGSFNVLDWIDTLHPLAETHVESVVGWICGESRVPGSSSGDFFRDKARELITCLLADLLWDPSVPPLDKTLRTLRARLVTPEDDMREMLETISQHSHSPKARQLASTLKGAVKETYSGTYQTPPERPAGCPPLPMPISSPARRSRHAT